jgi:hypothetical protein
MIFAHARRTPAARAARALTKTEAAAFARPRECGIERRAAAA